MNNRNQEIYERTLKVKQLTNILKAWVNPKITSKDINLKLEEIGFQYKNEKRRMDS